MHTRYCGSDDGITFSFGDLSKKAEAIYNIQKNVEAFGLERFNVITTTESEDLRNEDI